MESRDGGEGLELTPRRDSDTRDEAPGIHLAESLPPRHSHLLFAPEGAESGPPGHRDIGGSSLPSWQPMVDHEPIQIVPDHDPDPLRGILFAIPISAALWAALGGGIWFVLRLVS
jgi:hypothetical protein